MSADAANTTPEQVLALTAPTQGFLCPLSANVYGIEFDNFIVKNGNTNQVVFKVSRPPNAGAMEFPPGFDMDLLRQVRYRFPISFLDCSQVNTSLTFKVGDKPVSNFRMIERHYYKDTLIKSYDFNFVFCPPNSCNGWDAEYEFPELDDALKAKIAAGSFEDNQADTFYFVEGKLVMHNKAFFTYVPDNEADINNQ